MGCVEQRRQTVNGLSMFTFTSLLFIVLTLGLSSVYSQEGTTGTGDRDQPPPAREGPAGADQDIDPEAVPPPPGDRGGNRRPNDPTENSRPPAVPPVNSPTDRNGRLPELPPIENPFDTRITCPMRNKCNAPGRESLDYRDINCFCDTLCETFGDCCKDFNGRPQLSGERGGRKRIRLQKRTVECKRLREYNLEVEVYVVNACPRGFDDDDVRRKCEYEAETDSDLFYKLPVSAVKTGILYQNYYCAMCAGETNVSFWQVEVACDTPPEGNLTDNAQEFMGEMIKGTEDMFNCPKMFSHPTYEPRKCKSHVSRCLKNSNRKLVQKCKKSTAYVYAGRKVFKNKFCAACNGVNETYITCEDSRTPRPGTGIDHGFQFASFSLLLDFNTGQGSIKEHRVGVAGEKQVTVTFNEILYCPESHVYDPFAKQCRLLRCPREKRLINDQCVSLTEPTTTTRETGVVAPDYDEGKIRLPDGTDIDLSNLDFYPATNREPSIPRNVLPDPIEPETHSCPMIRLNHTEYDMYTNGSVRVFGTDRVYGPTEYEFEAPFLYVCSPFPERNYTVEVNTTYTMIMFKFDRMQALVSFVTVLVSLVALLILFITYLMLPPLRNTPGKSIMSLDFALFAAQILFLVGVYRTEMFYVCLGLAVAMHYFWLAAFFWMNALAFDVWHTFACRANKMCEASRNKRFVAYSLYAWFMPALVIGAALVLEFEVIKGVDDVYLPHYGDGICWIARRHALLFLFALPLAILLVTNFIFFFVTVINIYRLTKIADMLTKHKDRGRLVLYIKLSFIMGLTWVFGFLAAFMEMNIFWYLFISFNALQGVFICFAFVMSKKVFRLLSDRGRVHREHGKDSRHSNGFRSCPTNRTYMSDSNAKVIAQETSI